MTSSTTISCTVISPMFSYRAATELEPRVSELKGLMRYIYRISSQTLRTEDLFRQEALLFGGAVGDKSKSEQGYEMQPSPIRLQMKRLLPKNDDILSKVLAYRDYPKQIVYLDCYAPGAEFALNLHFRNGVAEERQSFYHDLVLLSLALGGLGKRVRRGRGCMTAQELTGKRMGDQLKWICGQLNRINESKESYKISDCHKKIVSISPLDSMNRPVIGKIILGNKLGNKKTSVDDFLKLVDKASHEIKQSPPAEVVQHGKFATGFARGGRFASSVIVSLTQAGDGLFPLYTLVRAVCGRNKLDQEYQERMSFIEKIEEERP